jgi:PTH1 family peptidyl-tRNA hydrolase
MTPHEDIFLIAGLGNPGEKYRNTRHNAGFMVADLVAETYAISLRQNKFDAKMGRGFIGDKEVILVKPLSFMNLSGYPICRIRAYFGITGGNMLIIHDDIDLPFGRIRLKEKGGHGGHRGVKSIMDNCGGGDFSRLRIGVGRSGADVSVADYVLSRFSSEELPVVSEILSKARDAVAMFLCRGLKECMNAFNQNKVLISS